MDYVVSMERADRASHSVGGVTPRAHARRDAGAGWAYHTFPALRRTWATAPASEDVDSLLVRDWG